jgi:hypothetical protein
MESNEGGHPELEHPGHARTFYRHPVDIPLYFRRREHHDHTGIAEDLAFGGIRFRADEPIEAGVAVTIQFPTVSGNREVHARVVWCHPSGDGAWEVGAAFLEECDHFRTRMVEQLFQIELYRREVAEREGRHLNMEEAAQEWVRLHAAAFPP